MFRSVLRYLSSTSQIIGALLDVKEFATLALNLTVGGGGIVVAFLQDIPVAIPIGLTVLVICITGVIVVRIVYRYRKWQRLLELHEPVLQGIARTLLAMHLQLTTLAKSQAAEYAKEDDLSARYFEVMTSVLGIVGLKDRDVDSLSEKRLLSVDGVTRSQAGGLLKYLTKHTKLKGLVKPLTKRIGFFVHLGSLLDLHDIGLTSASDNDSRYQGLHAQLREYRTKLAVSNRKTSKAIDTCLLYSYGLNSVLLHTLLYLHTTKGTPVLPDDYKAYIKQIEQYIEPLFNQVLEDTKQNLALSLIGESS